MKSVASCSATSDSDMSWQSGGRNHSCQSLHPLVASRAQLSQTKKSVLRRDQAKSCFER